MQSLRHKYVVLNNSSSIGVDSKHSYQFWFLRNLIRLIGDKPFSRGDIARIEEVNEHLQYITVSIVGDPALEKIKEELPPLEEIPVLLFLSSKIYLNEKSNYVLNCEDNIDILLSYTSTLDGNKSYACAITMAGNHGKISGFDEYTKVSFEWLVEGR